MLPRTMSGFVRPIQCATLLMALVAGAGCGGSTTAPAEPPRLTQATFVLKANSLCRRYGTEIKGIGRRVAFLFRRRRFEDAVLALGEVRRPGRMMVYQLALLKPPRRLEGRFRGFIRLENKQLAYIRGLYLKLSEYDFGPTRVLLARSRRTSKRANRLARSIGLRVCAG
jgi:hypothetical protein